MVLLVSLGTLDSARDVTLDVGAGHVAVAAPGFALLRAPLPVAVDGARARAKFEKKRQRLRVTIPVADEATAADGAAR